MPQNKVSDTITRVILSLNIMYGVVQFTNVTTKPLPLGYQTLYYTIYGIWCDLPFGITHCYN